MFPAKHLSISIDSTTEKVYELASNAENLPKWAAGLSNSTITKVGDEWETDSPLGKVRVRFAPKNNFGVMDHDVIFPSGEINHNPFRVLKNDMGSEVVFTLYRLPRMSDDDYQRDIDFIQNDLKKLKIILEK
jgi:hypothetical protein